MEIEQKRGDTLVWECEYTDDAGVVVDLSTYVIKCEARDKNDVLLFSLSSTENGEIDIYAPTTGNFRVTVSDTTEFGIRLYDVDIQYTVGTLIKSSETFQLKVVKDITL